MEKDTEDVISDCHCSKTRQPVVAVGVFFLAHFAGFPYLTLFCQIYVPVHVVQLPM